MQSAYAVLYCYLWPARLYGVVPHYLINSTNGEKKKVIEHKMCVLIFCTTFACSISQNSARYCHQCAVFMYSTCYACQTLMAIWIVSTLEKPTNIKFHENRPLGTEFHHADGQTDRPDEAFRSFANSHVKKLTRRALRLVCNDIQRCYSQRTKGPGKWIGC